MKRVIIWGTGKDYDKYMPFIQLEQLKGNIEICGVTSEEEYLRTIGGYSFIPKTKIKDMVFDYIIVTTVKFFNVICAEALNLGIGRECMIHPEVFTIPYFDFDRYVQVKEGKISIISNHCWGGLVYSLLKIPFNSPFINTLIDEENYIRLINDLQYYLQQPLIQGESNKTTAPIGMLGDVEIQFIHHSSFGLAKRDWYKRVNRVNYRNLFMEMTIGNRADIIQQFIQIECRKKVAFCSIPYKNNKNVIFLKDWEMDRLKVRYSYMFGIYILDIVKPTHKTSCPIDILKMLLGEEDFQMKR